MKIKEFYNYIKSYPESYQVILAQIFRFGELEVATLPYHKNVTRKTYYPINTTSRKYRDVKLNKIYYLTTCPLIVEGKFSISNLPSTLDFNFLLSSVKVTEEVHLKWNRFIKRYGEKSE